MRVLHYSRHFFPNSIPDHHTDRQLLSFFPPSRNTLAHA
jgi:hypothetical protein